MQRAAMVSQHWIFWPLKETRSGAHVCTAPIRKVRGLESLSLFLASIPFGTMPVRFQSLGQGLVRRFLVGRTLESGILNLGPFKPWNLEPCNLKRINYK